MRTRRFAFYAAVALLLGACREPIQPETGGWILEPVTAQTSGVVAELTDAPPAVRLKKEADGSPVAGALVEFRLPSPPRGVIGARLDTTDALGIATAGSWTLGANAGSQALVAFASGYGKSTTLYAIARPGPPAYFNPIVSTKQYVLNAREAFPPVVRVADKYNNPISGISVAFTSASDGGSVGVASATTNTNGIASSGTWTIPAAAGTYSVDAVLGTPLIKFTAQRVDSSSLVWYSLDSLAQLGKTYLPADWNIKASRVGVSPFDPCLCVNMNGFFFELIDYGGTGSSHSESSGAFFITGGKAWIDNVDSVQVSGNALKLTRSDYYYTILTTWIYSRKN